MDFRKRDIELNKVIEFANKKIDATSKEDLRVSVSNGVTQYYRRTPGVSGPNGKYIRKSEFEIVRKLAGQMYYKNLLKCAVREKYHIHCLANIYDGNTFENSFEKLHPQLSEIVKPIVESDRLYIKNWQDKKSSINNTFEIFGNSYSNKGEHVRSKSEKLIADILYQNGIPYKYEECLKFSDGTILFPDFTILDVKRRREVYLEHLGCMDDYQYQERAFEKIKKYENNGIYIGVNLLITSESASVPFNNLNFEKMVKMWLDIG